jgi:hypothetical protein
MRVKDFECRSYKQAQVLLKGREQKTVCNNTVLRNCVVGCGVAVLLHKHVIARLYADGSLFLYTRGYRTAITKNRLNKVLPRPWKLCQVEFEWQLWNWETDRKVDFVDGMGVPK